MSPESRGKPRGSAEDTVSCTLQSRLHLFDSGRRLASGRYAPRFMTPCRTRDDMIDASDPAEHMENTEAKDPIEPIDSADPTEPIDNTEPREPIDRSEFSDHSDHFEVSGACMSSVWRPV
jgi:hypothetical protein